jgi:hypothetical protein
VIASATICQKRSHHTTLERSGMGGPCEADLIEAVPGECIPVEVAVAGGEFESRRPEQEGQFLRKDLTQDQGREVAGRM